MWGSGRGYDYGSRPDDGEAKSRTVLSPTTFWTPQSALTAPGRSSLDAPIRMITLPG